MRNYKLLISISIVLFIALVVGGIGATYAFYRDTITGAVSGKTSDYTGEIEVVSETHSMIPEASVAVDEIKFYVKNFTGTSSEPTNSSEVYLKYVLSFTLPTWGSGCTNPISYRLFSVNESTNVESEITLTNNQTSEINFSLIGPERDYYKLKLYWDMTHNSASCYANKSINVGISANVSQRSV